MQAQPLVSDGEEIRDILSSRSMFPCVISSIEIINKRITKKVTFDKWYGSKINIKILIVIIFTSIENFQVFF